MRLLGAVLTALSSLGSRGLEGSILVYTWAGLRRRRVSPCDTELTLLPAGLARGRGVFAVLCRDLAGARQQSTGHLLSPIFTGSL